MTALAFFISAHGQRRTCKIPYTQTKLTLPRREIIWYEISHKGIVVIFWEM